MRKTKMFEGKKHVYDTEKAEALCHRCFGYYGDPRGYEETLYKTKGGLFFFYGLGGEESPYNNGVDVRPVSEGEATAWLEA